MNAMKRFTFYLLPTLFVAAACATSPSSDDSPSAVGASITADLLDGRAAEADQLFERYARTNRYREALYPVLFNAAHRHYESDAPTDAAKLLRFVHAKYPDSAAAREALLYALFVQRAAASVADTALVGEIGALLQEFDSVAQRPVWTWLVEAQYWIDRGRVPQAAPAFQTFRTQWDGQPQELAAYVTELDRWLRSHS